MKPDKSITITDASIKQVSIEVKVIKIDNKQMTLAVFRQLPEERLIDHLTGKLRGIPWGRVNYHVECSDAVPVLTYGHEVIDKVFQEKGRKHVDPHLHIVWQKGNELRRSIVRDWTFREWPSYEEYSENLTQDEIEHIAIAWLQSYAQLKALDQLFIAV